jgi:hypothetical protein
MEKIIFCDALEMLRHGLTIASHNLRCGKKFI